MKPEIITNNPADKAIRKLGGPTAIGDILEISRQAVNSWRETGVPTYFIRALSIASGVPIEEFLAFEEAKRGINPKHVGKLLKDNAEDRS